MHRVALALLALVALIAPNAVRQHTGQISGMVLDESANGRPLRAAIVTLTSPTLDAPRSTLSGTNGLFRFSELPAGEFRLVAGKIAYLTMSYGSRLPGRNGVALKLAADEHITDLQIRLPRGAVIAGAISAHGEPLGGVSVTAIPLAGPQASSSPPTTITDSLGRYRFFGLMPGAYLVVASPSASGGAESVSLAVEELAKGDVAHQYVLPPTFYPGVPSVSRATHLVLAASAEVTGVDFAIEPVPSSVISGTLVAPGVSMSDVTVQLCSPGPAVPSSFRSGTNVTVSDSGRFEIIGVVPGTYTLEAHNRSRASASGAALVAATQVVSTGEAVSGLVLVLRPAAQVRGTVRLDPDRPISTLDLASTAVTLVDLDEANRCLVGRSPRLVGRVGRDGSFSIAGVPPGRYRVAIALPASDWWLLSASSDANALDGPLTIAEDKTVTLSLRITDVESGIAGRLQCPPNVSLQDLAVVAFPAEPESWISESPRLKLVHPDPDGGYQVRGLPPGRYLVAVVSGVEADDLGDGAILPTLERGAARVDVILGRTVGLDLRVYGIGDPHSARHER